MGDFIEKIEGLELVIDRYNGATVVEKTLPSNVEVFDRLLEALQERLRAKGRRLLWLIFSHHTSFLISVASKHGFKFHNCDEEYVMMYKPLFQNAIVPTSPTHTIGASAVVINDENKLLVIKERIMYAKGYKLPGGHLDLGEKISEGVEREVFEETGIKIAFENIATIGSFYPHQFGKANIYFACKARALSSEITIQDTDEIVEARWMPVHTFLESDDVIEFNKEIVKSVLENCLMEARELESFKDIPKKYELFFPS